MRYFVFSTKKFDEESKQHSSESQMLQKFRTKAEVEGYGHEKRMEYADFPGPYFKKEHRNFRSIFTFRDFEIGGENVRIYVALRMLPRGEKLYEKFHSKINDTERDKITGISEIQWDFFENEVKERIEAENDSPLRPGLTDAEICFVENPIDINHEILDVKIFETKEWVEFTKSDNFKKPYEVGNKLKDYILLLSGKTQNT